MRQIRAKFRCMAKTTTWDGMTTVGFRPVVQGKGNPENDQYWSATPAGEAELVFKGPAVDSDGELFIPGSYYYINQTPDEGGGWVLSVATHRLSGGEVKLNTTPAATVGYGENGFRYGKLEMGFNDKTSRDLLDLFGEVGGGWRVSFRFAEPSDD